MKKMKKLCILIIAFLIALSICTFAGMQAKAQVVASKLVVSGFPSPTTAGTAHTFTVTAEYANNSVDTGYTGTVKITSSDGKAVLPANAGLSSGTGGLFLLLWRPLVLSQLRLLIL